MYEHPFAALSSRLVLSSGFVPVSHRYFYGTVFYQTQYWRGVRTVHSQG